MRFSFWPTPSLAFADVMTLADHVESTGWDGIWYADHFMPNQEDTSVPWPEAWTTLAAMASRVPRIRLGTLVTGNTYRHPAVLAKMASTVDHISGGRVVLGLGSGWQENEHRQYGIPFYSVRERLERLDEACMVIRSLFNEPSASYQGRFYQLENASLEPKPVQSPLPLMIGGGGEKRTLKITAKYANEWNVWGTVETLVHKMKILDQHCVDVGRDPSEVQRSAVALLFMNQDRSALDKIRELKMPNPAIIGTPEEVRDVVQAYEAAGVDELIVPDFTLGAMDQKLATLDTFITQVAGR